jgi:hypothetical protein
MVRGEVMKRFRKVCAFFLGLLVFLILAVPVVVLHVTAFDLTPGSRVQLAEIIGLRLVEVIKRIESLFD